MKKIFLPTMALFILLFTGCGLLTLHPIFTPGQLVMDTRLLGSWKAKDGYTVFEPASRVQENEIPAPLRAYSSKFYLCTRKSDAGTTGSRSLAFLVRIGSHYYLDLYPLQTEEQKKLDDYFSAHEMKMHTISRIDLEARQLKWKDFRDNYVEELVKKRQVRIRHTYSYDENTDPDSRKIVITASTEELQGFLAKYGDRSDAYNEESEKNIYRKIN